MLCGIVILFSLHVSIFLVADVGYACDICKLQADLGIWLGLFTGFVLKIEPWSFTFFKYFKDSVRSLYISIFKLNVVETKNMYLHFFKKKIIVQS